MRFRPALFSFVLAALLCVLALPVAGAQASRNQNLFFEAPGDLLDAATRDATLTRMDSLGVDSIRVVMRWQNVAPQPDSKDQPDFDTTDPAGYPAFASYDAILDAAKQRGWPVLLTVTGPVPRWATRDRRDNVTRPDPNKFAQFMTAVGRHFGDRVAYWGIWNEPNHPQFLRPQYDAKHHPASPLLYRKLFQAAQKGLTSAKVRAPKLLFGETAPFGTGKDVAPLTFLRGALCLNDAYRHSGPACAKLAMAGYAHHAYTPKAGPSLVPPGKNNVTIGVLGRLTTALDKAARAGAIASGMPLFLTEFGIQSEPDTLQGVSFQQQAEYRAISERIAYDNKRVKSFSQYLMTDDKPDSKARYAAARYPGFESGLLTYKRKEKPAYAGFRLTLAAAPSTKTTASLWGIVRPARTAGTATLQSRHGSSGAFTTAKTVRYNRLGFFTASVPYAKGRQYRVIWTAPDGTAYAGPATRAYRR